MTTYTIDPRPIQMCWTGPQQWNVPKVHDMLPLLLTERAPIIAGTKPRYWIHHPASWTPEPPTHNMAQFYTLPAEVRAAYDAVILDAWKYGPHAKHFTIGLTCHLMMQDPFHLSGPNPKYYDPTKFNELDAMWNGVVWPWHELLGAGSRPGPGVKEWGMEGGSSFEGWATAVGFGSFLQTQGIRPMVEGVPWRDGTFDLERCQQMPSWCLAAEFADNPALLGGQTVPPGVECHALLVGKWVDGQYLPTYTLDQIKSLLDRGWIVGPDLPHDALVREAMA